MRKTFIAGCIAVVGAVSIVTLLDSSGHVASTGASTGGSRAEAKHASRIAPSTQGPANERARFQIGEERVYRLTLSADTEVQGAGSPGSPSQRTRAELDGESHFLVEKIDPDRIVLHATFSSLQVRVDETRRSSVESALASGFRFSITPNGSAKEIEIDSEEPLASLLARQVVAHFQLTWPTEDSNEWSNEESDATATYVARYRRDGSTIVRSKNRYIDDAASLRQAEFVVSGETRFEVTEAPWAHRISSRESGTADLPGGLRARGSLTLEAQLQSSGFVSIASNTEEFHGSLLHRGDGGRASQETMDRDLVAGATLEELTDTLRANVRSQTAENERDTLMARATLLRRFSALFRSDPEQLRLAARAIPRLPTEDAVTLVRAMVNADTESATNTAVRFMTTPRLDEELRVRTARALVQARVQTPESMAALREIGQNSTGELRTAATLALGAGAALRARDASGTDVVESLIARLHTTTDPSELGLVLLALGNSGDARILAAVLPFCSSAQFSVRLAAVEALRKLDDPDSLAALVSALASDPHAAVRGIAATNLARRPDELALTSLLQAAMQDSSAEVRKQAIQALARSTDPRVTATLRLIRANDPDGEVRQLAAQTLARAAEADAPQSERSDAK